MPNQQTMCGDHWQSREQITCWMRLSDHRLNSIAANPLAKSLIAGTDIIMALLHMSYLCQKHPSDQVNIVEYAGHASPHLQSHAVYAMQSSICIARVAICVLMTTFAAIHPAEALALLELTGVLTNC